MSGVWLGVLTLPTLTLATYVAGRAFFTTVTALARHGISFEVKANRRVDQIPDYILTHNIWWERQWGPFFAGGWFRSDTPTRWVAIGRPDGWAFMAFRVRDMQNATDPARQPTTTAATEESAK